MSSTQRAHDNWKPQIEIDLILNAIYLFSISRHCYWAYATQSPPMGNNLGNQWLFHNQNVYSQLIVTSIYSI